MRWPVDVLVEGPTDLFVARRLLHACGLEVGTVYPQRGCGYVCTMAPKLAPATVHAPLLVLLDYMDVEEPGDCPPRVVRRHRPALIRPEHYLLRLVVRELESWLLADREAIAGWLGIGLARIPEDPQAEPDPKRTLVNLARLSRRRALREALVPRPGHAAVVGPDYVGQTGRFIQEIWRPDRARQRAGSLDRCLLRLDNLRVRLDGG